MLRFGLAVVVTSCVGGAVLFSACGDSSFDSSQTTTDGQAADVRVGETSSAFDGGETDAVGPKPIGDAGRIFPIVCTDGGHTLCDTFDGPTISSFWKVGSACSNPTLDMATSVSAPSSLATNDEAPVTNCTSLYTQAPTPLNAKFSSSFDVLVDTPNATGFAPFFAIWVSTVDYSFYEIALITNAAGAVSVVENLSYPNDAGSLAPVTPLNGLKLALNTWNHVDFSVDLSHTNVVDVAVNGGPVNTVVLQHRPTAGSVTAYRVFLGIPPGGLTKAAAHFDDFVCDVAP